MKVSNNALNFLLAQYRAIFKRAYVKGLASAVMLTAALAAGQAQADVLNNASGSALEKTDPISIGSGGAYDSIKISGGFSNNWNAAVTINSGAASSTGNYILGSGGTSDLAITGTGSLTIAVTETTPSGNGLLIVGDGKSASLTLDKVDVQRGELQVADSGSNSSGAGSLVAGTITIGKTATSEEEANGRAAAAREAYLTVKADSDAGSTLGNDQSTITVNKTGQLTLTAASTKTATVNAANLTIGEGGLLLINGAGTNKIAAADLNIAAGAFGVVSGSASGSFTGSKATVAGNLLVNGTLDINTTPATGTVTLASGSNTVISGTMNVNSGTLEVQSDADLHAANGSTAAKIYVKDATADTNYTTLKISDTALKSFLNGSGNYNVITEAGAIEGTNTGAAGQLQLSGSVLELTSDDTDPIDLATEFKFSGSAQAGMIYVESDSTIKGDNILISKQLNNGDAGTITGGSSGKIKIEATSLTLGNGGAADSDYGFKSATVRNLYGNTSDSINLSGAVVLDVTVDDIANKNGEIQGDFTLSNASNSITAKHGTFDYNEGTLTISGGELKVTKEDLTGTQGNIDTVLTISDTSSLVLHGNGSSASKITVDGANLDNAATVLDISEAKFSYEDGTTNNAEVKVQNNGVLKVAGYQLEDMLDTANLLNSGAKVEISGGTIQVIDNLTITGAKLGTASTAETIAFTTATTGAGTLQVDGTLTINSVGNIKLGAQSQVSADELVLNSSSAAAAIISGGNFTALSSVGGDKGINVSGANASLALGAFEQVSDNVWSAKSSNSTIKTNLTLSTGKLSVQNGSWTGANQSLTIAGGEFTVGDDEKVDASGNTFATSLSLNKIAQTGGTATIDTVGSVTTNSLEVTTGATTLQVNGAMTVDGVYTKEVPGVGGAAGTPASYGVELTAGKLKVGPNATLTFGADATKAIMVNTANDTSGDGWISIADNTFGKGDNTKSEVIGVGVGSTVTFNFDSDTSFGAGALAEFRKEIFGLESGNLAGFVNLGDAQIADLTEAIKNNEIAYDDLKGYIDVNSDFTTEALQNVKVTGIDSSSELRGSLGSLSSTELSAGEQIAVDGNLALNNAAANGGKFAANAEGEVLGLNVTENANVTLNKGGEIGTVSFSNKGSFVVASDNGTTKIAAIDGANATTKFATGTATVTGTTKTAQLTTDAGTNTTFVGDVTVGQRAAAGTTSSLAGDATFQGTATFYQNAEVANTGSATFAKDVTFEGNAKFYGDTTVEGTATTKSDITIEDDAVVTIKSLVTQGNIFVGSLEGDHAGAGTLSVETLSLNGNELVVDPAWDNATGLAFVGVNKFTDATTSDAEAGILNGQAYALQNSILSIGNKDKDDVLAIFDKYINAQGNLSDDKDGVGAIVYVAKNVEVAANGKIVADKTQNRNTYDDQTVLNTYGSHSVYIGDNSVLGVKVSAANGDKAAITFKDQADIHAEKAGKILLTGDYDQSDRIFLFDDFDNNIAVSSGGITVESINGLLKYTYNGGSGDALYFDISDMTVDTKRAASAFSATSSPVHESLVAYGTGNTDWRNANKQNPDQKLAAKTHGAAVSGVIASIDNNGNVTYYREPSAEGETPVEITDTDETKYYTVVNVLNPEYKEGVQGSQQYLPKVFLKADNALLSAINNVQANSGISAESAARMADFAGVAQVALKAGNSTSDAISGRMGMGAQNSAITYANNGQGAGLWVTPIYMNSDSDGFEAQGISYGTDINLYGVALGGDYTLANGIRVGAMFNVGSGDVDGQGAGSNVSSDFDYYGFGLYAGYTMGQFSIVGDVSYTAVDNDVEANTEFADIGKLETSLDSSNISFGVTGAYAFDTAAGVQVTPHVGLRYSYIDIDDYTVDSKKGVIGSYSADSLSVFSIPVGVTIASEFNAGSWSVKPSFDVTLTGNFGDDENEGTFHWNGVENIDCGLTSEIFDNFTYGATLGVAAQSASGISLGLSVGYTGSSNVDDFGVNANARFTF